MRSGVILTVAWLSAPVLTCRAEPLPSLLPSRDFTAEYSTGGAERLRVAWRAADRILRVDPPSGVFHMLVDHRQGRMLLVLPSQRAVLERPIPPSLAALAMPQGARFTRAGTERIGRYACTTWRFDAEAGPGSLCLSASNILLRAAWVEPEGGQAEARLERLELVAQDAERFRAPDGYAFLPGAEATLSRR